MRKFKKGDRVVRSSLWEFSDQDCRKDIKRIEGKIYAGTVMNDHNSTQYPYSVHWDFGSNCHCYDAKHLEFYIKKPILFQEEMEL